MGANGRRVLSPWGLVAIGVVAILTAGGALAVPSLTTRALTTLAHQVGVGHSRTHRPLVPPPPRRQTFAPAAQVATSGHTQPLLVVGLGDSVMRSYNCGCAGIAGDYAQQMARQTGRPVTALNLAWRGGGTDRLARALATPRYRLAIQHAWRILVMIGANDLDPVMHATYLGASCPATCYAPYVAHLSRSLTSDLVQINALRPPGSQVIVGTYWDIGADGSAALHQLGVQRIQWNRAVTRAVDAVIARAARSVGDPVANTYRQLITDRGGNPSALIGPDMQHPNLMGTAIIARAYARVSTV